MKNLKLWITIGVIALIALFSYNSVTNSYNSMVDFREKVDKSWSDVLGDYQRRMDLIPNLVSTVKGYADFEQKTLVDVIQARANATAVNLKVDKMDATTMQKVEETQGALSSSLSRLLVTIEKYPDLKANQQFQNLQVALEGTENRISNARRKYNDATQIYNVYIKSFPKNIYANMFGFEQKPYFEAAAGAEKAPEVKF